MTTSLANSSLRYLFSKSPLASEIPSVVPGVGLSRGGTVVSLLIKLGSGSG